MKGASVNRKAAALLNEALQLSETERAGMVETLLESLEAAPDDEVDRAWRDEVARRVAAVEAGEVEPVRWEAVRGRLWARIGEARRR